MHALADHVGATSVPPKVFNRLHLGHDEGVKVWRRLAPIKQPEGNEMLP